MVNKRPVQVLVYSLFRRRSQDDMSWDHLVHNLVGELKKEVGSFYGNEGSEHERNYPGFDYRNPKVRARLSRWPWHNKLFQAFKALDMTDGEIESLANWWGTARERREFEEQLGYKIRDTTGDDIPTLEDLLKLESIQVSESESDDETTWDLPASADPDATKDGDRQTLQSVMGASISYGFHNLPQQFTAVRDASS